MRIRAAFFVFALILSAFLMFSCGDTPPDECITHTDTNADGMCDVCGSAVEPEEEPDVDEITLIDGGTAKFQIVISKKSTNATVKKAVDNLVKTLSELDVEVTQVAESADNKTDCEVLIGIPTERGAAFDMDVHTLGYEGYAIKLIEGSLLIVGGSDKAIAEAIEVFTEEILGIDKKTKELDTVVVKVSDSIEKIQDDYRITSLNLDGEDMRGYTVAADLSNGYAKAAAEAAQTEIYLRTGYWLPLVSLAEADKSIVIKINENTYMGNGFYVDVKDGQLIFETEFPNKVEKSVSDFIAKHITIEAGDVNFTSKTHKTSINVRDIYYEDVEFGAKGNGVTDDFDAMKKCHEYANEWGHTVKAKSSSVFYIGNGHRTSIEIKTDVNWNNCKIIIDDSNIPSSSNERTYNLFRIVPNDGLYSLVTDKFKHVSKENMLVSIDEENPTTNIGWAPGIPCMLLIQSKERRHFIRYGANADSGYSQQEIILVDAEGNIDTTTPLQWTYSQIDYAYMYTTETERAITVENLRVDKLDNRAQADYEYYARGIEIRRSNTLLQNLTYVHTGEGDTGDPYGGLVVVNYCDNVTVKDYTFNKPTTFRDTLTNTVMGSYSITSAYANRCTLDNLLQTDYYRNDEGNIVIRSAHGSNYCKNMYVKNCKMAYFDAHKGTYNATITDSEIANVNVIGKGTVRLENVIYTGADGNTKWGYGVAFRQDYGATWQGSIELINVTFIVDKATEFSLIRSGGLTTAHYFGYQCYFPERFYIDGAKIVDAKGNKRTGIDLYFAAFLTEKKYGVGDIALPGTENGAAGDVNPYMPCKEIIIKNFDLSGINFIMTDIPFFTNHTKLYLDLDLDGNAEEIKDWSSTYGHKVKNKGAGY